VKDVYFLLLPEEERGRVATSGNQGRKSEENLLMKVFPRREKRKNRNLPYSPSLGGTLLQRRKSGGKINDRKLKQTCISSGCLTRNSKRFRKKRKRLISDLKGGLSPRPKKSEKRPPTRGCILFYFKGESIHLRNNATEGGIFTNP